MSQPAGQRLTSYQKKLFLFLSVATFFEGYDFIALAQILPELSTDMGIGETAQGALVGFINIGTVVAYLLVRRADRWGRRRVLMVTILGYTLFTVLSGLAPNIYFFALFQFVARAFLIGEWAISMVYAAEEFPAAQRGMVIGVIQAFSTLGSLVCVEVVPPLVKTELGWRMVYFVGVAPLLVLAYARRNIRETDRFVAQAKDHAGEAKPITRILHTPYKGRMLKLAVIWGLTYICSHNAVTFWKQFAVDERFMSAQEVANILMMAAIGALPLVFLSGKLLDLVGRRLGAGLIFLGGALGVFGSYTLWESWALTIALTFGIFGATAVLQVLNAYTTELFPTDLRGDAFAWSNNMLGRIGYVISPFAVGFAASYVGWGPSVAATALFPVIALGLILTWLPETKGRELEETSEV